MIWNQATLIQELIKVLVLVEDKHANDKIEKIKPIRGKKYDYLAMALNSKISRVLTINMTSYINKLIQEYPEKLSGKCWNVPKVKIFSRLRNIT